MDDEAKEINLPSGAKAILRKGKGRDLIRAHRAVAGNPEPTAISFALIAELVQINGKTIVYEDVLAMDLEDVLALQDEVIGGVAEKGNFQQPTSRPASDSSVLSQFSNY